MDLAGYEKHRVADIFPEGELGTFYLPASLKLDVACRVAFLPFAAVVLAVALSVLDAQTAESHVHPLAGRRRRGLGSLAHRAKLY